MLTRRTKKFCANILCGKLLRKKEAETSRNFTNRTTCDRECAAELRKQKTSKSKACFCGRPIENGSPYCCWDHRLIANRCKQWKIPLTISDYLEYSRRLEAEQRILDRYY